MYQICRFGVAWRHSQISRQQKAGKTKEVKSFLCIYNKYAQRVQINVKLQNIWKGVHFLSIYIICYILIYKLANFLPYQSM